jgi:hypothetical protein
VLTTVPRAFGSAHIAFPCISVAFVSINIAFEFLYQKNIKKKIREKKSQVLQSKNGHGSVGEKEKFFRRLARGFSASRV